MEAKTKELLELFIDKADEMLSEEFRTFLTNNPKISYKFDSKVGITAKVAPNRTLIKSFATSYRLFTSGENISIGSLKAVLFDPGVSKDWKDNFQEARNNLNDFLDTETHLHIGEAGKVMTNREIADVYINGWIFHVKDTKKLKLYRKWSSSAVTSAASEQVFIITMHIASKVVEYIADISRKELGSSSN